MNYRTTSALLIILAALGAYMFFFSSSAPKKEDDANLQVLNLDAAAISTIEVRQGGKALLTEKNAEGWWQLVKPGRYEGDQTRMLPVVYSIAKLKATKVVATEGASLADFGLDKPQLEVILGIQGSDSIELLVGSQNPAGTGTYLKRSGSETIYLAGTTEVGLLRDLVANPPKKPTPTPEPTETAGGAAPAAAATGTPAAPR